MSSNLIELKSEDELIAVLARDVAVILHFYAAWAEQSLRTKEIIKVLARKTAGLVFVLVDADAFPDIATSYDIEFVPSTIFTVGKTVVMHPSSASSPSDIQEFVQAALDSGRGQAPSASGGLGNSSSAAAYRVESASIPIATKQEINKRIVELINSKPVMAFIKGTPN
ncbi:Monothiol glutaredoxin-4, partial [Smittium mucronatum]